jgi:hypothetical protein
MAKCNVAYERFIVRFGSRCGVSFGPPQIMCCLVFYRPGEALGCITGMLETWSLQLIAVDAGTCTRCRRYVHWIANAASR